MQDVSRRSVLSGGGAALAATALGLPALAKPSPHEWWDTAITSGPVTMEQLIHGTKCIAEHTFGFVPPLLRRTVRRLSGGAIEMTSVYVDDPEARRSWGAMSPAMRSLVRNVAETIRVECVVAAESGNPVGVSLINPSALPTVPGYPKPETSKGPESVVIMTHPGSRAPCDELIRVYDHFLDDETPRLVLRDALRRAIEPSIEGIGPVRVIGDERSETLVVLRAEPWFNV